MTASGLSWLREEDVAIFEEGQEENAVIAERNAKMRENLKARKRKRQETVKEPEHVQFEEFMEAKTGGNLAEKPSADDTRPPWFVERPDIENNILRLHEEMMDFLLFMKQSREEVSARRKLVQTITRTCQSIWPKSKVRVFGSFFTGLSLPNGDVDMTVMGVPCKTTTAMKHVAEKLLEQGEISYMEMIETAKVPIVKIRQQSSGLRADIVFEQPDGIESSKFMKERMQEYPALKPLCVFFKYFLLQRGLSETFSGGMGSYLLCNVVLHFLQRHPSRRDPKAYANTSLGHLLYDFLKYYGQEFRYDDNCISVVNGGRVFPKNERGHKGKGKGKKGLSLCLESPKDPSVDIGAACFRMPILKNLFQHAFHCLCHMIITKSPADVSMITPLLLDPSHPVIAERHNLIREQKVALPGLPRTTWQERKKQRAEAAAAKLAAANAPTEDSTEKKGKQKDYTDFSAEVENWALDDF